jgi:hypothetical protein
MNQPLYRKTSYSEVQTWLRCNREHYYAYGLNLTGIYNGEALERGIIGHACLAEYYKSRQFGMTHDQAVGEAFKTLSAIAAGSSAYKAQALAIEVLNLCALYFEHIANEDFEVLAVETEYSVGMLEDYRLPVRIDVIIRSLKDGRVKAYDHKFVKDFYDEGKVRLMPQLRLYKAGLMAEGVQVDDIVYNMIRHRATKENQANPDLRFMQITIPANNFTVRRTLEEHLMAANRIAEWRKLGLEQWEKKVLRNPSACFLCSFKELCSQELEGEDTTILREFEYRVKTPREDLNN